MQAKINLRSLHKARSPYKATLLVDRKIAASQKETVGISACLALFSGLRGGKKKSSLRIQNHKPTKPADFSHSTHTDKMSKAKIPFQGIPG